MLPPVQPIRQHGPHLPLTVDTEIPIQIASAVVSKFRGFVAPAISYGARSFPQSGEFLRRIESLLTYLIPHYIREGKSYLTIAIGCTGGKHRSVMLGEQIKKSLAKRGFSTKVTHRDIEK